MVVLFLFGWSTSRSMIVDPHLFAEDCVLFSHSNSDSFYKKIPVENLSFKHRKIDRKKFEKSIVKNSCSRSADIQVRS